MKAAFLGMGLALSVTAGALMAKEPVSPVQQHNSNAVWFENWIGLSNASMTIAQPGGEIVKVFAASGTPVFKLTGDKVLDGIYRFELSAATENTVKIVNQIDNGRGDKKEDSHAESFTMSGYFTVSRGVIITPKDVKEE